MRDIWRDNKDAAEAIETILNNEDFASETTLDTRLSSLETKMDTLLNSQDEDNNITTKQSGNIVEEVIEENITITSGSSFSNSGKQRKLVSDNLSIGIRKKGGGADVTDLALDARYRTNNDEEWLGATGVIDVNIISAASTSGLFEIVEGEKNILNWSTVWFNITNENGNDDIEIRIETRQRI